MRYLSFFNSILVVIFIFVLRTEAADWPGWRGPNANGISNEVGWNPASLDKAVQLWQTNVGVGHSSFAVRGNYVYTMGNKNGTDIVYCFDAGSGKEIWQYSYACELGSYPGPRATPRLDGKFVYTLSQEGHLFCLDALTGKLIWQKHIEKDFGAQRPGWGYASSPFILGEMLLLNVCKNGLALNKKNGEKIWVSNSAVCGYASPVILPGEKSGLFFGQKALYGVDLKTGAELWSFPWETSNDVNASDPVVFDNKIFITSGYKTGCALLDISKNKPQVIWQNKNMSTQVGSGVYLNGYVYGANGQVGKSRSQLICIDMNTGETLWTEKMGFNSLMIADNKLIVLNEKGRVIIAEASPDGFKEISGKQVLPTDVKCWTAPILANGRIYNRNTNGDIVCLGL